MSSRALRDGGAVAAREVVEHDHLVAGLEQLLGDDRADVAGAAGDEELHGGGMMAATLCLGCARVLP